MNKSKRLIRACNGGHRGRKGAKSRLRLVAVSKFGRRGWDRDHMYTYVSKRKNKKKKRNVPGPAIPCLCCAALVPFVGPRRPHHAIVIISRLASSSVVVSVVN